MSDCEEQCGLPLLGERKKLATKATAPHLDLVSHVILMPGLEYSKYVRWVGRVP